MAKLNSLITVIAIFIIIIIQLVTCQPVIVEEEQKTTTDGHHVTTVKPDSPELAAEVSSPLPIKLLKSKVVQTVNGKRVVKKRKKKHGPHHQAVPQMQDVQVLSIFKDAPDQIQVSAVRIFDPIDISINLI